MKRKHSTIKLEATGKHTNTRKYNTIQLQYSFITALSKCKAYKIKLYYTLKWMKCTAVYVQVQQHKNIKRILVRSFIH